MRAIWPWDSFGAGCLTCPREQRKLVNEWSRRAKWETLRDEAAADASWGFRSGWRCWRRFGNWGRWRFGLWSRRGSWLNGWGNIGCDGSGRFDGRANWLLGRLGGRDLRRSFRRYFGFGHWLRGCLCVA